MNDILIPNWPAPSNICALTTLKNFGNVCDQACQQEIKKKLQLPAEPIWLNQIHSTIALPAENVNCHQDADASFTSQKNRVCVVKTADCLPILLCAEAGNEVAAIHAGWRGLVNGIIENTVAAMQTEEQKILAWLGPAIGPEHFEVGEEVRTVFVSAQTEAEKAFKPSINNKWLANLYELAKLRLSRLGIDKCYMSAYCTYNDQNRFYSYRREGKKAGRMATFIWINE